MTLYPRVSSAFVGGDTGLKLRHTSDRPSSLMQLASQTSNLSRHHTSGKSRDLSSGRDSEVQPKMTKNSVDIGQTQPLTYKLLMDLHHVSEQAALAAGVDTPLIELIKIRASQINGCAFCLRMHTADAVKLGETPERLAVLSAWRETEYFTEFERVALELTGYLTNVSAASLSEQMWIQISDILTEEQIASMYWVTIVINAFNRVAISSHLPVRPRAAISSERGARQ